jgi:hypothetical protein
MDQQYRHSPYMDQQYKYCYTLATSTGTATHGAVQVQLYMGQQYRYSYTWTISTAAATHGPSGKAPPIVQIQKHMD